jgi:predicted RNA binding protein YcfA (HicA-like mRNA interferase family)
MRKSITFAKLDRLLVNLGFVVTTIPNSHTLYEHVESGAVILLRLHRPSDPVDARTLGIVRKTVVDFGVAEPDVFEQLSQKTSA